MIRKHNGVKYMFFWGGCLSNWYISPFVVNGIEYNCGEQYMMHQKAILFNDKQTASEIMKAYVPKKQKELGRKIKNFDTVVWDSVKYNIVKAGLLEKFKQNEDLKLFLSTNKDCQMVEASPFDRIWGIGFNEMDAIDNINMWGENLLGKILTEISKEI